MAGKEFFRTRTVAEVQAGFRPSRRTQSQDVPLDRALGRVPSRAVLSPGPLPGFARATVDGYAVRAADTFGSSEGLPTYLELAGAVLMGTRPDVSVRPGTAVAVPTGGALPDGADAVVMIEHTAVTVPGTIEVTRPAGPGEGLVRADEDVAAGAPLVPAGRPLRPQDLGLLAAAGVTAVRVHARPRVAVLSTGDEVVPPSTAQLHPGQVRDATATALGGLVAQAGGEAVPHGIVRDDATALEKALGVALADSDVVVVSAGSSVGTRDETAGVVGRLGPPGIWCHGIAVRPGKPTLLAECGDVPLIGLPGNPLSALVVFRLVGMPIVRAVGGVTAPPTTATVTVRLARPVASAAGRYDVVQVRLVDGAAVPLFGHSALLSVLAAADGFVVVPEQSTGLDAGSDVLVTVYG